MKYLNRVLRPLCINKAQKITKHCGKFVRGRILDVGAGRCLIAKSLKNNYNANVTCLDIDNLNETDLKLDLYDGSVMPYKNSTFDTTLIVYVLHHCTDPLKTLKECIRVSKNNGRIIIFEDFGFTLYTYLLDWVSNKMHNVDAPLNFKKHDEWLKIFKDLDLEVEFIENGVEKQIFYPFVTHTMFVLKVKK
jgi:ubiquinone/menaquinone biosynthesis C-methylase UbiE